MVLLFQMDFFTGSTNTNLAPSLYLLVQQHFPFQPFGDEAGDIESQAGALPEVVGLFKTFEDGFEYSGECRYRYR